MHRDPNYDVDHGLVGVIRVTQMVFNTQVMTCPPPEMPTGRKDPAEFHLNMEIMNRPGPEIERESTGKANVKITTHVMHGAGPPTHAPPPSIGSMNP